MHEQVVFDAMEIERGVLGVANGEVKAGNALHPFDVGFELAAHVGGDLAEFGERLGVTIAGHEREDEALPGVGGERVRRVGDDGDLAEGFNRGLNDGANGSETHRGVSCGWRPARGSPRCEHEVRGAAGATGAVRSIFAREVSRRG